MTQTMAAIVAVKMQPSKNIIIAPFPFPLRSHSPLHLAPVLC
jgi:hypothetical protein